MTTTDVLPKISPPGEYTASKEEPELSPSEAFAKVAERYKKLEEQEGGVFLSSNGKPQIKLGSQEESSPSVSESLNEYSQELKELEAKSLNPLEETVLGIFESRAGLIEAKREFAEELSQATEADIEGFIEDQIFENHKKADSSEEKKYWSNIRRSVLEYAKSLDNGPGGDAEERSPLAPVDVKLACDILLLATRNRERAEEFHGGSGIKKLESARDKVSARRDAIIFIGSMMRERLKDSPSANDSGEAGHESGDNKGGYKGLSPEEIKRARAQVDATKTRSARPEKDSSNELFGEILQAADGKVIVRTDVPPEAELNMGGKTRKPFVHERGFHTFGSGASSTLVNVLKLNPLEDNGYTSDKFIEAVQITDEGMFKYSFSSQPERAANYDIKWPTNSGRGGNMLDVVAQLPKAVSKRLREQIEKDPTSVRKLVEQLVIAEGGVSESVWTGQAGNAPIRPPYEELPDDKNYIILFGNSAEQDRTRIRDGEIVYY